MSEGRVVFERRDRIGWITLDRPEKLNALARAMREELRDQVAAAARDEDVLALVITGAGDAFCAGGDVGHMVELKESEDEAGFRELLHAGAEVVLGLQSFPGLVVAAVNGVAAGAGLGLALACDLRLASPTARLGASWSRIGLVPDWGATFWLPRLIGPGPALEMVLSGRLVGAGEAASLGLVHEVVDEGTLDDRAQETAEELGAARHAVTHAKALMRGGLESSLEHALAREAEAQEECFDTDDFAEGLAAFREGRDPEFRGE